MVKLIMRCFDTKIHLKHIVLDPKEEFEDTSETMDKSAFLIYGMHSLLCLYFFVKMLIFKTSMPILLVLRRNV